MPSKSGSPNRPPRVSHRFAITGAAYIAQDAGGDSGGTGDSDGNLPSGYLEPCEKQGDCAAYEADNCLINPLEPEQSACVTQKGVVKILMVLPAR